MAARTGVLSNEVWVQFSSWRDTYKVKLRRWPDHSLEFTVYDSQMREVESIMVPPQVAAALFQFD